MIEKYEDLNESYKIDGWPSASLFSWGEFNTDQTGIANYESVDGKNVIAYVRGDSGSCIQPCLSRNISEWTSGVLSDWEGKSNSEVLKIVTESGGKIFSIVIVQNRYRSICEI